MGVLYLSLGGLWAICIFMATPDDLHAQPPKLIGGPQEEATRNATAPCLEPPPLVKWENYRGPLKKAEGIFARKLERRAVHVPRYKPDALLCSLAPKDKFRLFIDDTIEPASFLSVGFFAGLDQATNRDPSFGLGATGYGKRFGVEFAGQTTWRFLKEFAYPTAFSEDPRYYRLGHGNRGKRLFHAAAHSFVAFNDNGKYMFNATEWLGTVSAVALNAAYNPGDDHRFGSIIKQTSQFVALDMGFDVVREFFPEIARKLKLPFRDLAEKTTERHH
jgi:hypothetical protein